MSNNFTVLFWSENHEPVATAHTHFYADALALATSMPNAYIIDFKTGEILYMRWHNMTTWEG